MDGIDIKKSHPGPVGGDSLQAVPRHEWKVPQDSEPPARRTWRYWRWLVLGLVVLSAAALVLIRRASNSPVKDSVPPPAPSVAIDTATVRKGDIGIYINALGTVTPLRTVNLTTRVDGQIMDVHYVEGQMVKAGDLLVEIDPRPYQAALTQAEGQLARDKALLENARVDLDRYQIASRSNAIPKQTLDTQIATVHQYEGTVKYDQGQVDSAQLNVTYSRITAPVSGRIGLRLVDPGNIVHATDTNPLAVITQLQPITVIFSVAEDYLPEIQRNSQHGEKLVVDAFDRAQQQQLATGTLLTTDNQIDTTTGTVRLKAQFSNTNNSLFPNQFVNARLLADVDHNVTLVPTAAIQRDSQGSFAYVVQTNQTVAMRTITVGATDGTVAAVEGVEPGEQVALSNFNRLQDGAKVMVRSSGGRSASAEPSQSARHTSAASALE